MRAEVPLQRRPGPLARAEALLAADVERQLRAQLAFGLAQEAGKAAEMVVVAVAQHQRVEPRRVDAEQPGIVEERLGREAVVNKQMPDLVTALRLDMQRQAKLADQRLVRRLVGEPPAEALDRDIAGLGARCDRDLVAVDHYPDRYPVHLRRPARESLCPRRPGPAQQRGHQRPERNGSAAAQDIPPVDR